MHIFSTALFLISSNLDNLTIAIAYGIKKVKITPSSNLVFSLISALGTLAAMSLGKLFYYLLPIGFSNALGSFILISLGIWSLYHTLKEKSPLSYDYLVENPQKMDLDNSGVIEIRESFFLGFALALNNIGMGFGASITGLNPYITSLLTFIFCFVAIAVGYTLGSKYLSRIAGKWAEIASAIIIILLGIL